MTARNEFSRPFGVEGLGRQARSFDLEARPQERTALARRFELLELPALSAQLAVRREPGELISVSGHLSATIVQSCVVTLEPLPQRIERDFELLYALAPLPEPDGEVVIDPEGVDPPEPLPPGGLDLGEAVAEQLALVLDPYPRAPGATFEALKDAGEGEGSGVKSTASRPFAALARLKQRN